MRARNLYSKIYNVFDQIHFVPSAALCSRLRCLVQPVNMASNAHHFLRTEYLSVAEIETRCGVHAARREIDALAEEPTLDKRRDKLLRRRLQKLLDVIFEVQAVCDFMTNGTAVC